MSKLYNLKENSIQETNTNLNLGVNNSSYEDWTYNNTIYNDNVLKIDSNYYMNSQKQIIYCNSKDIVLSNEYYYSGTKQSICKYDGTVVKDLSEGNGAANIGFYGNKYYIESSTGYYYILDEIFNKILEPIEMSVYNINSYGIMSRDKNNTHTILYNHNLEDKKELSYKLKKDPKYFIAEIESTSGYFNLNTQDKLIIYK